MDGDTLVLRDHRNFKTYTAKCVGQRSPVEREERFLIFARSQCGEEHYKCLWIKNRGDNALEFQIGAVTSEYHDETLCQTENFENGGNSSKIF